MLEEFISGEICSYDAIIGADHDWPWWRKQVYYFMGKILGDLQP